MNKPTKPNTSETQRGISVVELLFAVTTIATAVLIGAMPASKKPPLCGD